MLEPTNGFLLKETLNVYKYRMCYQHFGAINYEKYVSMNFSVFTFVS